MACFKDAPRETALRILYDINEKGAYSNIAIDRHLRSSSFRYIDKTFITGLVYGTVKWGLTIDHIIGRYSNIPIKRISPWILNILRLGIYQLIYTDRIPMSAACNESVKLAAKYGHKGSKGYVNGLLRSIARDITKNMTMDTKEVIHQGIIYFVLKDLKEIKNPVKYLSIKHSHPEWMVERWVSLFGEKFTEALLKINNENPDFSIRVNTLKISKDNFVKKMEKEGIEYVRGRYIENAFLINNPTTLINSQLQEKGYFQVQDEASMLVSHILDPLPGELIMDVCAAPGGKTAHIVQIMNNKGTIIARDIHKHKIRLINDTIEKLGLDIVKTEQYDALKLDENYIGKADRVLVDAPCSGLGIIRRKPDVKWSLKIDNSEDLSKDKDKDRDILIDRNRNRNRNGNRDRNNDKDENSDINSNSNCSKDSSRHRIKIKDGDTDNRKEIERLQYLILENSAKYVKPGGVLVYSTCTIEPRENIEVVTGFLKQNHHFYMENLMEIIPPEIALRTIDETWANRAKNVKDGHIQLFPNVDGIDGFFIARMRRRVER